MTTEDLSINENKKKVEMVTVLLGSRPKTFLTNQMGFRESIITSFCKFITNRIFRLQHNQVILRINNTALILIWLATLEK